MPWLDFLLMLALGACVAFLVGCLLAFTWLLPRPRQRGFDVDRE